MVDNQHKKITGYRDLSESEIALMNRIKEKGEGLKELTNELRQHEDLDQRWVSVGITDLQKGIMSLVRAVAKPDSF